MKSSTLSPYLVNLTYFDLFAHHLRKMSELGRSPQEISNHKTALKKFIDDIGATEVSTIGEEFGPLFKKYLADHLSKLSDSVSNSTLNSRKSLLCKWHKTYKELLLTDGLPQDFADALSVLIEHRRVAKRAVCRAVNIPRGTFNCWIEKRRHPSFKMQTAVTRLEEFFELPTNTLLNRLNHVKGYNNYLTRQTAYGKKISELKDYPYRLAALPARIEEEFQELSSFYTSEITPFGLKRNSTWRVKKDGSCPTQTRMNQDLRDFFGFLALPKDAEHRYLVGLDYTLENLSIAYLADPKLVEAFINFKKNRSGGYNGGTLSFLNHIIALTRKDTGFIWQKAAFSSHISDHIAEEHWQKYCEQTAERMRQIRRELKQNGHAQPTRDVNEPIKTILKQNRPLRCLLEISQRMELGTPLEHYSPQTKASFYRNLLILKLMISNPLRLSNFLNMTYHKDNSGNLYKSDDGGWRLRFQPRDFKNERGAAKNQEYDVAVNRSVWRWIELYLHTHRKHLANADSCQFVFLPDPSRRNGCSSLKMHPDTFTRSFRKITCKYSLPEHETPGFGPHAVRHIVVTDFLKTHPNSWDVAAAILHDTVETVKQSYAHLKTSDRFAHWDNHFDDTVRLCDGGAHE